MESAYHRRVNAYGPVSLFIAPSEFMGQVLLRAGYSREKIRILPHCVAPESADSYSSGNAPVPVDLPFMLYAGRLEEEKGMENLLYAARRLPHVPFVLAGTGSMEMKLNEATALMANVSMVGKLDRTQLLHLRKQARAEIVPAIWPEVFGMSALEAMQAGLPVIASAIGGLPDIVRHEETGLLVAPGNKDELVDAISRLWMNESLASSLGAAGQRLVQARYGPAQHLEALLDVYRQAMYRQGEPVFALESS